MADTNYAEAPEANREVEEVEQEDNTPDSETVLVDKSVFGDSMPKPGDKVTFEFVREYEDEAELKVTGSGDVSGESSMESDERDLERMAV